MPHPATSIRSPTIESHKSNEPVTEVVTEAAKRQREEVAKRIEDMQREYEMNLMSLINKMVEASADSNSFMFKFAYDEF